MNNFKKIGLTALAGSLVSVSAYAGEMQCIGGASMTLTTIWYRLVENISLWVTS